MRGNYAQQKNENKCTRTCNQTIMWINWEYYVHSLNNINPEYLFDKQIDDTTILRGCEQDRKFYLGGR